MKPLSIAVWILVLLCRVATADAVQTQGGEQPALFEQIKSLEGTWRGKSTKGWEDTTTFRVIAKGTAVLSTSNFTDSPNEGMATVYIIDSGIVLLTHYCEAGNQPVLEATSIENSGNRITFTFRGGTNLPSRDTGHMDQVILEFVDKGHFTEQWYWYAKGKQTPFEKIMYERAQ